MGDAVAGVSRWLAHFACDSYGTRTRIQHTSCLLLAPDSLSTMAGIIRVEHTCIGDSVAGVSWRMAQFECDRLGTRTRSQHNCSKELAPEGFGNAAGICTV
jgi:hypothetical protein